jgi:hypothetical protein
VTLPSDEPPLLPVLPPAQPVAASAMPKPIATAVTLRVFLVIVETPSSVVSDTFGAIVCATNGTPAAAWPCLPPEMGEQQQ